MKVYTWERKVMWGDLDPLGIVFYPRYYEWMDGSSHMFFESLGIPLGGLLKERGIIFALLETGCRFIAPLRYHETISFRTSIVELSSKTVKLRHQIFRGKQGEIVAEGAELRICLMVDGSGGFKATEIPPDLKEALQSAL